METNWLQHLNQPGWDWKFRSRSLVIEAPSEREAREFCQIATDLIARGIANLNFQEALILVRGSSNRPYRIPVCIADTPDPIEPNGDRSDRALNILQSVYCSELRLPHPLVKRLEMAVEDDRPVSIVKRFDRQGNAVRKQIAVNEPMVELLSTPPEVATQREMSAFWRPADLEALERRFRQETRFTLRNYQGGLNPQTWARLDAEFDTFEIDGAIYGYVRNLDANTIAIPSDMMQRLAGAR